MIESLEKPKVLPLDPKEMSSKCKTECLSHRIVVHDYYLPEMIKGFFVN